MTLNHMTSNRPEVQPKAFGVLEIHDILPSWQAVMRRADWCHLSGPVLAEPILSAGMDLLTTWRRMAAADPKVGRPSRTRPRNGPSPPSEIATAKKQFLR